MLKMMKATGKRNIDRKSTICASSLCDLVGVTGGGAWVLGSDFGSSTTTGRFDFLRLLIGDSEVLNESFKMIWFAKSVSFFSLFFEKERMLASRLPIASTFGESIVLNFS